ncbi:ATPase [Paenibacillus anaericanus]|uniref:ATPase n=1 Tax=Paenibacillus anaericanus TaxID=170367 RepID=A0A3S1CBC9_9BACL|nr:BadF/BadG/BcrA/BcrD ATPase family protein [Paenibacillus anaericanus]RUT48187.1 ATPase [Paenibacillus anaericanus]
MEYYLGIDAGGSKTSAVITDRTGSIVGKGLSGCGNHQLGVELARSNIDEAIQQALHSSDLNRTDITYALFGLAGADREADYVILRPMIKELGFAHYDIACDTVIGLRAGTRQPYGVVLICGTGTNCFGINPQGKELQCGGFGYAFGDFGGGSELAVEVLRSVIRSWEGREESTLLTAAVLDMLGYTSVDTLFHDFLDEGKRIPKDLTKLLFPAADQGDLVARRILRKQGTELGLSARAVINRLQMQDILLDVVLVGSVLTRNDGKYMIPYIQEQLTDGCTLRVLTMEPVAGAILLAMENDGLIIKDEVYEQLELQLSIEGKNSACVKI